MMLKQFMFINSMGLISCLIVPASVHTCPIFEHTLTELVNYCPIFEHTLTELVNYLTMIIKSKGVLLMTLCIQFLVKEDKLKV